jgi:hypothetical protein
MFYASIANITDIMRSSVRSRVCHVLRSLPPEYVQSWIEELLLLDTPVTGEVSLLFSELAMLRLHLDSLIREFLDLERDRLDVLKIQYRHLTHSQQSVCRRLQFKRPHLLASLHATHSLLISHCTHPGYTIPLCYIYISPIMFQT